MVASLCAQRFPLVALSKRSTSASVRYSRVRRSALGRRVGVTVRFTVAGVTSLRCDLTMRSAPPDVQTVRIILQLRTVSQTQLSTLGTVSKTIAASTQMDFER